jgi:hypothetical protein
MPNTLSRDPDLTPRGRIIQKNDRTQLQAPILWRTHLLANRQKQNPRPGGLLCRKRHLPWLHICWVMLWTLFGPHPILFTLSVETSLRTPNPSLYNNNTNWEAFRLLITEHLQLNVPLKTTHDIDAAINSFNNLIQRAGWDSIPEPPKVLRSPTCPLLIKQNILIKRRLRWIWLRYHSLNIKRQLNSVTRELKQLLSDNHNACFQQYIQNLSSTASTDYSLWKAIRKSKHITPTSPLLQTAQGTWARTNTDKVQTLPII